MDPYFQEIIRAACDLGTSPAALQKQHPSFDFSIFEAYLHKSLWSLEILQDRGKSEYLKEQVITKLKNDYSKINSQGPQTLLSILKEEKGKEPSEIFESNESKKLRS